MSLFMQSLQSILLPPLKRVEFRQLIVTIGMRFTSLKIKFIQSFFSKFNTDIQGIKIRQISMSCFDIGANGIKKRHYQLSENEPLNFSHKNRQLALSPKIIISEIFTNYQRDRKDFLCHNPKFQFLEHNNKRMKQFFVSPEK